MEDNKDYCPKCKKPLLYPSKPCPYCNKIQCNTFPQKNRLINYIVVLVITSSLIYFIPQTPEYSLYKIITAFSNKDYDSAKPYINIDAMTDEYISENISLKRNDTPIEIFGNALVLSLAEYMKPTIKKQLEANIKEQIENEEINPCLQTNKVEVIALLILKKIGKTQIYKEKLNKNSVRFSYISKEAKYNLYLTMKRKNRTQWAIIEWDIDD
jgi:hypothetical protein